MGSTTCGLPRQRRTSIPKSRYIYAAPNAAAHKLNPVAQAPDVPHPRAAIALPAVPAPHAGTSYNPPEAAHTTLLLAAHEAELRRVQEAEALAATKARILGARNIDGEGTARGMLIDKPVDDPAESEREPESVNPTAMPLRKTKQQRRKAEKLRAEVRWKRPFFLTVRLINLPLATRNLPLCNGRCEKDCTHPSTLPNPYAKPQRRHRQHVPRSQHNAVQRERRSSRRVVWRDRSLANMWCAREKWTFSSARSSVRACVAFRYVMHIIVCGATADAVGGSPRATCSGIDI